MKTLRIIWLRIRSLCQRREMKREIDEELRFHLEQRTAENIAAGMTSEEAAREARKRFGNVQYVREECREVCGASFGETVWQDVRFGARMLRKNPGFTAVAVLTLALGIGANLALFTLLDDGFLRPRPVRHPEELWAIVPANASGEPKFFNLSLPYYDAIREYQTVFKGLTSLNRLYARLQTADGEEETFGDMVPANYFDFVGTRPCVGRGFLPEEDKPGADLVTVISYRLWQEHFEGIPDVVGKSLKLDGHAFEVVGVAPQGFVGLGSRAPNFWVTYAATDLFFRSPPLNVFGRLRDGVSPSAAADSLAPIVQEITKTLHPTRYTSSQTPLAANNNAEFTRVALLRAGYGSVDRQFAYEDRKSLIQVNSLAGLGTLLVMLIAAANLANLLLARGLDRHRELATRVALGATCGRLVRELTLEGVLLSILGCAAALFLLNWFGRMAPALMSAVVFFPDSPLNFHPDMRVVAFAVGLTLLVGIGFSLPPALLAMRFDPFVALKDSRAGGVLRERRWSLRKALVVAQVVGSLVLVSSVFLCLRGIRKELSRDVGFGPEPLMVARIDLEQVGYTTNTAPVACEELRRQLSLLPGVEEVGLIDGAPLRGERGGLVTDSLDGHEGTDVEFGHLEVGPGCFHTLGIPILEGCEVAEGDFTARRHVALVNESFVRKFWPGQQVLGKVIGFLHHNYEVIGVVRDARLEDVRKAPRATAFLSLEPAYASLYPTFIVRTRGHAESLMNPIRAELRRVNPRLLEGEVRAMRDVMQGPLTPQRNVMNLLAEIGVVALGLTMLGAYGLMSYLVKQRTHEIGVRLAVGARRADVVRLVLGRGLWLALAGTILGLPAAFGCAFLLRHLVFGVSPLDLLSLVVAAGAVSLAILVACWLPARRAARVDPMVALRYE
jgi:predicted permease